VVLTPTAYRRKTAFQIDPLLHASVVIREPDGRARINGELDTVQLRGGRRWLTTAAIGLVAAGTVTAGAHGRTLADTNPCPTVTYGDSGQAVVELQWRLTAGGWPVVIDGYFGGDTLQTVARYQTVNGLFADGIVGPRTQDALGCTDTPVAPSTANGWHDLALSVGWTEADWPWLSCVIDRESHGQPDAYNGRNQDRSYGLVQLNTKGSLWRWFTAQGLTSREQLFDPATNLFVARIMFSERGRQPWGGSCR
jgi:hypothetical protein